MSDPREREHAPYEEAETHVVAGPDGWWPYSPGHKQWLLQWYGRIEAAGGPMERPGPVSS